MKRMLFNAAQPEELRVAIVSGENLLDLDIESSQREKRKSNIYVGVVTRVEPSLDAVFVDYGVERHGFLPFKEISPVYGVPFSSNRSRGQSSLCEGQELMIQIEKEERGSKGAALTTYVSLAGRYLVLMPNNPKGGGVSRRVEGDERVELKSLIEGLELPAGMSLIGRTAAIGRSREELHWDLQYLLKLWDAIFEASRPCYRSSAGEVTFDETNDRVNVPPFLIYEESSIVIRAIRDYFHPDIEEILIDNEEIYEQAKQFMSHVMPHNLPLVKLYSDSVPLFSRFQIEKQIETVHSRTVVLPSGGAVVFDHSEALVAIDVNSSRATGGSDIEETAFQTNLEAAEEIGRQLRLRDLGGLIVIDFIDMEAIKNQRAVEQTLRDALQHDRARVQMGKISKFGLLELSRQRLRSSLGESVHTICPRCSGTGFIRNIESSALHILRVLQETVLKEQLSAVHVHLPVDVATFLLNEKRSEIMNLEKRSRINLVLVPNIHFETPAYYVHLVRSDLPSSPENEISSYRLVKNKEASLELNDRSAISDERSFPRMKPLVKTSAILPSVDRSISSPRSLFFRVWDWFKPKWEVRGESLESPSIETEPVVRPAPSERRSTRQASSSGESSERPRRRTSSSQESRRMTNSTRSSSVTRSSSSSSSSPSSLRRRSPRKASSSSRTETEDHTPAVSSPSLPSDVPAELEPLPVSENADAARLAPSSLNGNRRRRGPRRRRESNNRSTSRKVDSALTEEGTDSDIALNGRGDASDNASFDHSHNAASSVTSDHVQPVVSHNHNAASSVVSDHVQPVVSHKKADLSSHGLVLVETKPATDKANHDASSSISLVPTTPRFPRRGDADWDEGKERLVQVETKRGDSEIVK